MLPPYKKRFQNNHFLIQKEFSTAQASTFTDYAQRHSILEEFLCHPAAPSARGAWCARADLLEWPRAQIKGFAAIPLA